MAVDQTPPALPSGDATYQTFYDSLAQYGSWIELPSYGYVWQPAPRAGPAWRPYTVGHWVFTDRGWTWMSDEPFGWATYHYGRWMRTGSLGWVWAPGDEWAPAWVSWRFGNDFVGWAPLPPEARFSSGTVIQQWADKTYSLGADDYTFVPRPTLATRTWPPPRLRQTSTRRSTTTARTSRYLLRHDRLRNHVLGAELRFHPDALPAAPPSAAEDRARRLRRRREYRSRDIRRRTPYRRTAHSRGRGIAHAAPCAGSHQ